MAAVCRPVVLPRAAARTAPRVVAARASVVAEPVKIAVQSLNGSEAGSVELAMKGTASTKTRAEVRGGGRKPGPQKGGGGARQGSIRTPLKRGGGVVFGPKPKDWSINLNKKERRLAMATALQSAAADMVVVDSFAASLEGQKTKSLVAACKNVGVDVMMQHTLIITTDAADETHPEQKNVRVAGKNIERLQIVSSKCLQFYEILRADKIIMEQGAVDFVNEFYQ